MILNLFVFLKEIFLRSYNDTQYRSYVLNQLGIKKSGIERSIKKQQDDVKVLEDTIENISDGKVLCVWRNKTFNSWIFQNWILVNKLGVWLMEFQKEKMKLNTISQGIATNSLQSNSADSTTVKDDSNIELMEKIFKNYPGDYF